MGCIVTFYSYKGGVGRTMALANISVLLAKKGLRVLAVDWDFEAPGLHRYFREFDVVPKSSEKGLIDLLVDAASGSHQKPNWRNYVSEVLIGSSKPLVLLSSGRQDQDYASRVLQFDWPSFFRENQGGEFIESLRNDWRTEFDIVLVDSRTGITDAGGVCTIQLPDVLVLVFSANEQSLFGVKEVAQRAQRARQSLAYDRMPLLVFPLPSRFDSRTEFEESQKWLQVFARELEEFYADWLPRGFSPLQIVERTKVPYVAFFSFGEKLPVVTHGISDPEGLGHAYEVAATLIASDFKSAPRLLKNQGERDSTTRLKAERSADGTGVGIGMTVFPLSPDESIELEFALETIYQRGSGGNRVTRDLLIKNSSARSVINHLRLGFPYPFVDVRKLTQCRSDKDLSDGIAVLKQKQIESVRVSTLDLLEPQKPVNWIYRTLPYVNLRHGDAFSGVVAIHRDAQELGPDTLRGYVKRWWVIQPAILDNGTWFFCAVNGIALLDFRVEDNEMENLRPGESMWIRLVMDVPASGYNRKSLWQRTFASHLEFSETWMSPNAAHRRAWLQMSRFEIANLRGMHAFQKEVAAGKSKALNSIPHPSGTKPPRDWRVFTYTGPGLELEVSAVQRDDPKRKAYRNLFELPREAYAQLERPSFVALLRRAVGSRQGRIARVFEYFCGTDFETSEKLNDVEVELIIQRRNHLYNWFVWLGFVGFLLAAMRGVTETFPSILALLRSWAERL